MWKFIAISCLFFSGDFIVISQQLSGAAMVRRWSAYIHPRLVWSQVCDFLAHRSGGRLQEETELEIKDG